MGAPRTILRRAAGILAGPVLAAGGCTTQHSWNTVPPTRATLVPTGRETPGAFSSGVLPLGSVPYDGRSLPLVSPDGALVATQVGAAPEWPSLLAEAGAPLPDATRVEIHRMDRELGETARQWSTATSMLLGRSGDGQGFLVESPRPGGARWIGLVSWHGGDVQWLVDDDQLNAFACLGPGGRLAWSRRVINPPTAPPTTPAAGAAPAPASAQGAEGDTRAGTAEHFDLIVGDGENRWTLGAQGGDWLMPAWSGQDAGLFVFHLAGSRLEVAYMDAADPQTAKRTLVRLPIADGMTLRDAYQAMASGAVMTGEPVVMADHLFFWHPAAARMALWLPLSSPAAAMLLERGSIAAVVDESGNMLVATAGALILQDPIDPARRRTLLPGTHVPRPVMVERWPWMLLSPGADRIGLVALRLVRE